MGQSVADRIGTRRRALLAACAIAAIAFLVYFPALRGEFLNWDDQPYLVDNQAVHRLDASTVVWAFTAFHSFNWHPLTWLSHALDYAIFGERAWGHHLTSIVLHAINAGLLVWVLWRATGALAASWVVAALFALHPLHVESVAWLAERKDVLSTLFWLWTLLAYVRYAERPSRGRYAVVTLALVAGLLSKPMVVTLPCVLLLMDFWPLRRLSRVAVLEKLPWLGLSAASSVVTLMAQSAGGAALSMGQLGPALRLGNAVVAYVRYLGKTFWPEVLLPYYPYGPLSIGTAVAAAGLLLAITAAVVALRRRAPWLAFGWLWYVGTLVPVIGLVQVGGQAIADRYTYVPLIGIFVMLVWSCRPWLRGETSRRVAAAATVVLLLAASARTVSQIAIWHDSLRLWEHAAKFHPESSIVQDALADAYFRQIRENPDRVKELNGLGNYHLRRGALEEAAKLYRRSIQVRPDHPAAYSLLGAVRSRQDRLDEAIELYRQALALEPRFVDALNNLGVALAKRNDLPGAVELWERALAVDPSDAAAQLNLARVYELRGDRDAAARQYEAILRDDPGHGAATRGLERLRGAASRPR